MYRSAIWQIQQVLFDHFEQKDFIAGIYNHIPKQAKYPYIYLSRARRYDYFTATSRFYEYRLNIALIDKSKSLAKVAELNDRLLESFYQMNWDMPDYILHYYQLEHADTKLAVADADIYKSDNYFKLTILEKEQFIEQEGWV